jgi:hypothetical protein
MAITNVLLCFYLQLALVKASKAYCIPGRLVHPLELNIENK